MGKQGNIMHLVLAFVPSATSVDRSQRSTSMVLTSSSGGTGSHGSKQKDEMAKGCTSRSLVKSDFTQNRIPAAVGLRKA